jgi:membrane protease YdiL (CAAX protease family)
MTFLGLDLMTWILMAFLTIALPIMGRSDMRSLRRGLAAGKSDARLTAYERGILFQWGFSLLLAIIWIASGRSLGAAGLVPEFGFWAVFFGALALAATIGFVWQVRRATSDPDQLRDVREQMDSIEIIAPHTDRELARFDWLSVTAGICEEFIYRGVLLGLLASSLGIWPAILISSVVFGIGHAYQGPVGVLRTGLVGLVMAIVVTLTGSLFVAMVAHAAIDISQGRMLRAAVDPALEIEPEVLDAA